MKWMKDPLAGFISRCGARMGKFTALLVTIAMLAGTTGAGATAFADETVTDGGNVAAESAASQPESTQQSDAENAVGSDVADIAGQDVAGQSATDDDDAQCLTDDGESHQPSNEQAQSQLQSQSQPEQPSETMPEQRQPCDKTEQPNEQKEQERQAVRQPTAENADVPANGAAPTQDGDRNDHAGENRTDAVANGDAVRQPMTAKPAMRTMLTTMATLLKMPTMPTRTVRMTPTRMPRRLKTATITTRMMLPKTMPTPTNTSCAIASPSIAKP